MSVAMRPRTLVITRRLAGRSVVEILRAQFHLNPDDVRRLLKHDGIRVAGNVCKDLTWRVRVGQKLEVDPNRIVRHEGRSNDNPLPAAAENIRIVHADAHVVVVDKPAGLTTVRHASETAEFGKRAERFLPETLIDLLPRVLREQRGGKNRLRAVHRLDKETSGLLVVARTAEAERQLGLQFRARSIDRTYLALVRGRAQSQTITSFLVADRGDGRRGSGEGGQKAVTEVRVVEELGDYTLVECTLETGRTHQVRIHLGEQGTPLCGERVYDRPPHGQPAPDESGANRPLLHAATLAFDHPVDGKRMDYESRPPRDMRDVLKRLRKRAP
jgi:23S rRNA pseudouridine1911/1915/1917 synthase